MNVENIKRAIEYVKTIDPENFDMCEYRRSIINETPECGSVGCIVGHCTALDAENVSKKFTIKSFSGRNIILFTDWSEEFFDIRAYGDNDQSNIWEYMFSDQWSESEKTNTIEHAIFRMQNILDGYKPTKIKHEINLAIKKY